MSSIGEDQEGRILAAVHGLVISRVQARLSPEKRGIRALEPIQSRVPGAVAAALEQAVAEVLAEVEKEVEAGESFMPEERP